MSVRVVVEHDKNLFSILGLSEEKDCPQVLTIDDRTFYRCESTPRWVLYRGALSGHGDSQGRTLQPEQR